MRIETVLRDTMTGWSEQAGPVPADLAQRALRHRTRVRVVRATFATAAAGLLVATGVAVVRGDQERTADRGTVLSSGGSSNRPSNGRVSTGTGLRSDPNAAPPRRLVAAGNMVLSSYYTIRSEKVAGGGNLVRRTWYLLDPRAGTYRKTPWAFLSVAPGLARAAVLEGPLPTSRVGLLDMTTGKVARWITLSHNAGGVAWSPDGRRLLVSAYGQNPDQVPFGGAKGSPPTSTRTGYEIIDMGTMKGVYRALPANPETFGTRQDMGWSRDGKLIWAPTDTVPTKVFYDLDGRQRSAPAHEADVTADEAGVSPDGSHYSGDGQYHRPGPATAVYTTATGKVAGVQPVEQLVAWADDAHLIAIACEVSRCTGKGEFRNRYVLVGIDGKHVVPLTGFQKDSQADGAWSAVFTAR